MSVLVCFDVDGTLDVTGGPVPLARLYELQSEGVKVAIVSPSGAWLEDFPLFLTSDRDRNLSNARQWAHGALPHPNNGHPSEPVNPGTSGLWCIYVSDNMGDRERAEMMGFTYIRPEDFR